MPGYLTITKNQQGNNFAGVTQIYQYVNADGKNTGTACGQAACATLLSHFGFLHKSLESLRKIEISHGADLGPGGTTPFRIGSCLEDYGAKPLEKPYTRGGLTDHVRASRPVIVLVQNAGWINVTQGAHWFVVFACNDGGIFGTNLTHEPWKNPFLSWDAFMEKWTGVIGLLSPGFTSRSRRIQNGGARAV